jgi:hypothetical protein
MSLKEKFVGPFIQKVPRKVYLNGNADPINK